MPGSMRKRGPNSWQLSEREARRQLKAFLAEASDRRVRAATLSELLDRWFAEASTDWLASALETKSLLEHHLKPHLGHLLIAKLTTADIDDFYAHLRRAGGEGTPLAAGTVHRVHVVHRALQQAVRWEWRWATRRPMAARGVTRRQTFARRARMTRAHRRRDGGRPDARHVLLSRGHDRRSARRAALASLE